MAGCAVCTNGGACGALSKLRLSQHDAATSLTVEASTSTPTSACARKRSAFATKTGEQKLQLPAVEPMNDAPRQPHS